MMDPKESNCAKFKVATSVLLDALRKQRKIINPKSKTKDAVTLELSLDQNKLTLSIPGAYFNVEGSGYGLCKATVRFLHFYQIIADEKSIEIEISFMDQTLHIGALSITMQAVYFDKATSFRTMDLSANYSELDLVRIIRKNYRDEELVFNNLYSNLQRTKYDYENRLVGAYNLLKHYGIKYEELEALIDKKLGMD